VGAALTFHLKSADLCRMKLLAVVAVSLAMCASAAAQTSRSAPRSERRAEAASQRQGCRTCERNSRGRIRRSTAARHEFQRAHPCPSTGAVSGACPGYVVHHVIALMRGGADAPSNMQWQTVADAKAKDRIE
jgi:hypothetical protein